MTAKANLSGADEQALEELEALLLRANVLPKDGERAAQTRGIVRRYKLLEAAKACLDEQPLNEVTYQQIANRAGISLPSCYHFYANKVELLVALASYLTPDYVDFVFGPYPEDEIDSWQDIIRLFVDRTVVYMRPKVVNRQLFLGPNAPPEVVAANVKNLHRYGSNLLAIFDALFDLPQLTDGRRLFFNATEIVRLFLSLDEMEHNSLSDAAGEEAARAATAYLEIYLPRVLKRRSVT